jgi:eukaryotic-like serine/threonine-protein kinase
MPDTYLTFGNYLLLKQRSQDGLGSLWRAGEMDKGGFKRIVWLRRFDEPRLDRAALDAEMALTGKLAQTFKATNVVRNAAGGTELGMPYLAWDYVPAQPLDQILGRVTREHFPIAVDNALLIVEKMAAALVAAAGVELRGEPLIHGFLVPHFVLVGNDGEAMVAGFGIARGLIANLDRTGVRTTAAPYLAPEVLTGGTPSRRSDVYSLGSVLYQLLTGAQLPAEPEGRAAALEGMQLALEEGPVPQDIAAIVRKSLSAKPEDRFATAADLKRDLERLLYGGAYSPTTFNLALFMDRLYRQEIEDEDRELQRERALDVAPYYKPPRSASPGPGEITGITEAPPPNRTPMFIAIFGVAILLAVVLYLVFGRSATPPAVDLAAQQKAMGEAVANEVARQLAEKETQLRAELEQERTQIEAQRKELQQKQAAVSSGQKLSAEDQRKIKQAEDELAARVAEQKRKEDELAKVREQQKTAAAMPPPTAPPAVVAKAPASVPTAAAPAAVVAAASEPTMPPKLEVSPTAVPPEVAAAAPTGQVHEGDYVDFANVDVRPLELIKVPPVLPRSALMMAHGGKGIVILSALVNEKGGVDSVEVMRGFPVQHVGVDEACSDAVKQYRYRPASKGGVAVKTKVTVAMQVDLSRTH